MLGDTFSWVDVLPEDDRREFATDFSRAFETATELERTDTARARVVSDAGRAA
ncbi:hypothetical protein JOF55_001168 [Haloactinomyces albus]|uniref:Uncharacterized protein n=1 Tax=Haloactinomyces albus TaxID=1352928 RepID=A0AAE4CMH9_9ACTN|nr:hypothetical protein [Haloactinomyces albus]